MAVLIYKIYKITNLINGKIYVGQTMRSIEERFKEHCRKKKYFISKAIHKYGKENFKLELIAECETLEKANELEMYWIKTLNCKAPNGYNLTDGGNGHRGCKLSEEAKKTIGDKNRGHKHSKESRLLMSIGQKKRYENPLEREKKSAEQKKRYEDPNERKKLSAAQNKRYKKIREQKNNFKD